MRSEAVRAQRLLCLVLRAVAPKGANWAMNERGNERYSVFVAVNNREPTGR